MFKEMFSSFFRTLGKILCIIFILGLIFLIFGELNVKAATYTERATRPMTIDLNGSLSNLNTNAVRSYAYPFSSERMLDSIAAKHYSIMYPNNSAYNHVSALTDDYTLVFDFYTTHGSDYGWKSGVPVGIYLKVCSTVFPPYDGVLNGERIDYIHNTEQLCNIIPHQTGTSDVISGYVYEMYFRADITSVILLESGIENGGDYTGVCYDENEDLADKLRATFEFTMIGAIDNENNEYLRFMSVDIPYNYSSEVVSIQEYDGYFDSIFGNKHYNSITDVINDIPNLISSSVSYVLNYLLVPSNKQINEIITLSRSLTENFGFIGESFDFFINIFTTIVSSTSSNGTVTLPAFTMGSTSLFDSVTFWEEQTVSLSDNPILSSNITTIRSITSIGLVCLFVSWAARNIFNILSKNSIDNGKE